MSIDLTIIPRHDQDWERFRARFARMPRLGVDAAGYILHATEAPAEAYYTDPDIPGPMEPDEHPCPNCGELASNERSLCDLCWNAEPVQILRGEQ